MKLLSLFSGIGAFEKALTNLDINYELVGFSEIDKWAIESYCAIHNVDKDLNLGDIRDIKAEDLSNGIDLITYGFPCKDVSNAGKLKGITKNTQSGLLYEAERIIEYVKPKYAIAENVRNLVSKRFKKDFEQLLKRLNNYGYNNYWKVLNAKDYGIPQNRERVFIVSIRKDIDNGDFEFPKPILPTPKLVTLLDNVSNPKYDMTHTYYKYFAIDDNDKITKETNSIKVREAVKKGYTIAYRGDTINVSYPSSKARRGRIGRQIAQTIQTLCYQTILDEDRLRKLTPLECWRLMGFDDEDYWKARRRLEEVFYSGKDKSDTQMYKQAGNSITVNVLEEIFKCLMYKN